MPGHPPLTFRLHVRLLRTRLRIWRRVEVPCDLTLDELAVVLDVAMGWSGRAGREFSLGTSCRDPYRQRILPAQVLDAWRREERGAEGADGPFDELVDEPWSAGVVRVRDVLLVPGDRLHYRYGVGWQHLVRLEKVVDGAGRARVLAGRRACPPEYLATVWSYEPLVGLARALADRAAGTGAGGPPGPRSQDAAGRRASGALADDAAGGLAGSGDAAGRGYTAGTGRPAGTGGPAGGAVSDERELAVHYPGLSPAEVLELMETFDVARTDAVLEAVLR